MDGDDGAGGAKRAALDARRDWMAVLAKAKTVELEEAWALHGSEPEPNPLRAPESGLVMVRGRAGGSGRRFNLGEMTVTRCSVQAAGGAVGHAYVAGRDRRKAELAARFDALLQDPERQSELLEGVIAPLAEAQAAARREIAAKAAATRVDFFTMVRGED